MSSSNDSHYHDEEDECDHFHFLPLSDDHEEIFNPSLKRERIISELKNTRLRLERLQKECKETEPIYQETKSKPNRHIFEDGSVEIVVHIMKQSDHFHDILRLTEAFPRVKEIFEEHQIAKYFALRIFTSLPERITDHLGFLQSHTLVDFEYNTHAHLPSGKYVLGPLKATLMDDIYDDLWIEKDWKALDYGGVFHVNNYNGKSGIFAVFLSTVAPDELQTEDGYSFNMSRGEEYFGCIPLDLVKGPLSRRRKIIEAVSEVHVDEDVFSANGVSLKYHDGRQTEGFVGMCIRIQNKRNEDEDE